MMSKATEHILVAVRRAIKRKAARTIAAMGWCDQAGGIHQGCRIAVEVIDRYRLQMARQPQPNPPTEG